MRFLLALALVLAIPAVSAQGVFAHDAAAIKAVITEQIEAFKRDDGAHAFSLATPGIRQRFGTPEVFLEMVRSGYPVVYRPGSVRFDYPEVHDGTVIQAVRLTDAEGRAWLALYPMERQPDGAWRINGCQLARLPGRET
ncbi:MAG: DUF4864 domain-containing protein [Betaproteobacteria bacterium]